VVGPPHHAEAPGAETVDQAVAAQQQPRPGMERRGGPSKIIAAIVAGDDALAACRFGNRLRLGVRALEKGVRRLHRLPRSPPRGALLRARGRNRDDEGEVAGSSGGVQQSRPAVILRPFTGPAKEPRLLSFFDDGEDTAPRPSTRAPRSRGGGSSGGSPKRPRPRRTGGGPSGYDQHALMVRRRWAAGIAIALVIIIVLVISSCLSSQKQQSLKDYNHAVSEIARESDTKVSKPFFTALSGAAGKSAIDVQVQVNQLSAEARELASRAKGL